MKNFLGELIYRICRFNKGLDFKRKWNKRLYKQLFLDVYFIRNFVELLLGAELDYESLFEYFFCVEKQRFRLNWEEHKSFQDTKIELSSQEKETAYLILKEINVITILLLQKGQTARRKVVKAFHTIHNLPLIYIDDCGQGEYSKLSIENALQYYHWDKMTEH